MKHLREVIEKIVKECLEENRYFDTATPYNSHNVRRVNLGRNPLHTDIGGHATNDVVSQVSTVDDNGANFVSEEHHVVSDNRFTFYKVKNFGSPDIKSTMDLFGGNEKELRREIDRLNGAATRNDKGLKYRTITSESNANSSNKSRHMLNTFWEFSFNGGQTWYVMMPNAVDNMKQSTFKV